MNRKRVVIMGAAGRDFHDFNVVYRTDPDVERDESLAANRGGFSFLVVHGLTWTAAAALTFVLPQKAAALVYLSRASSRSRHP